MRCLRSGGSHTPGKITAQGPRDQGAAVSFAAAGRDAAGRYWSAWREAAPRDKIWGIGLGRENPAVHDPLRWRGRNLLGFALVKVRAVLRGELVAPKSLSEVA